MSVPIGRCLTQGGDDKAPFGAGAWPLKFLPATGPG